ncbi:SDR family oxidoreductase [Kitasatospora sp. NPDC088346]|uniref:SDR family oxidoreductase n=1 Tax=Kitasatospora sp. NPDC088346 TaxID=3364073 RepID=UPI00380D7A8C
MERILVIGATGRSGGPVARRLHRDGATVRILARDPERARAAFGPGYEIAAGDVESPDSVRAALTDCTGVHVGITGGPRPRDYDRIEHLGTATVARLAAEAGVRLLTYVSGSTVRAEHAGFPGTAAKLAAEEAIRASGVPFTVFRPSWFMESLPSFVRGTRATVPGRQQMPYRFLAADDFAGMVSAAHRTGTATGRTLTVLGPQALSIPEALAEYCAVAHPGSKVTAAPLGLLRVVAALTRDAALATAVGSMAYFQDATEAGDPAEADDLFGAPTTTVAEWSHRAAGQRASTRTA